ncbi:MAG: hypothetical protein EOM05_07980 [Clostridia bacterium]|nr:hypothetical protein [Clostridia bacterium]
MVIKSSRFLRTVTVIVTAFVLVISTQLSSFAVYIENNYRYNDNVNYEIIGISSWSPKGEITIPSKATAIKSGAFCNSAWGWTVNVSKITKVTIPASVKYIESGAFTSDCSSLKEVVIQNAKSKISVANNAFPSRVTVTYTVEETTQTPTTQPTVPTTQLPETTQAESTTTTTVPSTTLAPKASNEEATTSKTASKTTSKVETTKSPEEDKTTEETTTQPSLVAVNDNYIPLADIKNDGYPEELEAWNVLVNSTGDIEQSVTTQAKQEDQGPTATTYAVSAAAVVSTFTTIILTYFKFKR